MIIAVGLIGVVAVPAAGFFVLMAVGAGDLVSPPMLIGLPSLIGFVVALWLWRRARRTASTTRGWLFAALGVLLFAGTSVIPVTILGAALGEEWRETQPGGRGYQAPAVP